MRVLIVTDAWHPQVNGVVRTLDALAATLAAGGVGVEMLTPAGFPTLPLPSYPEIRLAIATPIQIAHRIRAAEADCIHIATEGPLGLLARRCCLRLGLAFTTSYHTRFPEFLSARLPLPESWSYAALRGFHNAGQGVLAATPSLAAELTARGFARVRPWTRGVDAALFHPARRAASAYPRPVFLNVGRVAVEKNLEAFLGLELPGSKVVVGDGPELARLRVKYPEVHFPGMLRGEALAAAYASADVFVFPSRTDTFGNVILEAMASGCPVAAYPVTGPRDILADGRGGALSEDLRAAALAALHIPRAEVRAKATEYTWAECARQFLGHLVPAEGHVPLRGTSQRLEIIGLKKVENQRSFTSRNAS